MTPFRAIRGWSARGGLAPVATCATLAASSALMSMDTGCSDNAVPVVLQDAGSTSDGSSRGGGLDALIDIGDVGGGRGDGGCGGTTITATKRDVSVLLLLDKSGSMRQRPAGFRVKKWTALRAALSASLERVKNRMAFGVELFPHSGDPATPIDSPCKGNCCELPSGGAAINVPVQPGTTSVPKIIEILDATSPGGGTPTADALQRAYDYFATGGGKELKGDRYVLLATDGGPNCNRGLTCTADKCTVNLDGNCPPTTPNCCDVPGGSKIDCLDDDVTVNKIAALKGIGVKTFVVGIPGSEAYSMYLDKFADVGGAPSPTPPRKYFVVSAAGDVEGLTGVLSLITGELISTCRLQLTEVPEDDQRLNVFIDDKLVPQSGPDGWELDKSTTPPTVVLKGKTCQQMTTKGAKVVDIRFGCATIR